MAAEKVPPRRLGRGLDALLGKTPAQPLAPTPGEGQASPPLQSESALQEIPLATVRANRYQPRKEFDPAELQELRESIKANGLLQPITVRQLPNGEGYELIAGERRLRAVRELEWNTVPAIIRDDDDRTMLTLALVENLQREDLNPIEEAEGYVRLVKEFGLTQQEVADLVGKDRSTIANLLRVLNLPAEVRRMLEQGGLTLGHARALLGVDDAGRAHAIAKEIVERDLSVRSIEQLVNQEKPKRKGVRKGREETKNDHSAEMRWIEDVLRARLQTDVSVARTGGEGGKIQLLFYSNDDLQRLLELIGCDVE